MKERDLITEIVLGVFLNVCLISLVVVCDFPGIAKMSMGAALLVADALGIYSLLKG